MNKKEIKNTGVVAVRLELSTAERILLKDQQEFMDQKLKDLGASIHMLNDWPNTSADEMDKLVEDIQMSFAYLYSDVEETSGFLNHFTKGVSSTQAAHNELFNIKKDEEEKPFDWSQYEAKEDKSSHMHEDIFHDDKESVGPRTVGKIDLEKKTPAPPSKEIDYTNAH